MRIRRTETVHYWIDYTLDEVITMLAEGDNETAQELAEMEPVELAEHFGCELRSGCAATDRVIESGTPTFRGSSFDVFAVEIRE